MATRAMTVTFDFAKRIDVDAATGAFHISVVATFNATTTRLQFGRRLQVDTITMKYRGENGAALWDVSPAVVTAAPADALAACNADIDAAVSAGVFDLVAS